MAATETPTGNPDPELIPGPDRAADGDADREPEQPRTEASATNRPIDVAKRVAADARDDNISLIGAGVAFFSLLSLAPALAAIVSIYGLFADPADVSRHINDLSSTMPSDARSLLTDQLDAVVNSSRTGLSIAIVVGVVLALWGASSAIKQLLVALSAVYGERETRTYLKLRAIAALITLGAIAFVVATVVLITVVPSWVDDSSFGTAGRTVVAIGRWPALAAAMMLALSVLYRLGPDRRDRRWQWVSWGAAVATVLWLGASALFSLYATHFGSYNKTYGALAAVVVLMLWLYLSALCVLIGAEINRELERRPSAATT